jgi:hypothetical protein
MTMHFNMLSSYTTDDTSAKFVAIKTSGNEKMQVTMLEDSMKLPPYSQNYT